MDRSNKIILHPSRYDGFTLLSLTTVWRFRPKKRTIKLDMVFNFDSFLPSIFHFLDGSPAKSKLPSRGELFAFDFTVFHYTVNQLAGLCEFQLIGQINRNRSN